MHVCMFIVIYLEVNAKLENTLSNMLWRVMFCLCNLVLHKMNIFNLSFKCYIIVQLSVVYSSTVDPSSARAILVTPCLLMRIQEFIHTVSQYHARPKAKRGIGMFVKFWNVSAALKSQIPLLSGLNHRINTVLLDRIEAVRKEDDSLDRHCDVINDVPFSLYYTLMMSNVRYVYILHSC